MSFDIDELNAPSAPEAAANKRKPSDAQLKAAQEHATLEEERSYRRGTVSIRDLIAPASYEINSSFLKLGDTYLRTMFVTTYPRYVGIGWGAPVINYNGTIDIGMFFYPIKPEVILKQLKNKVGVLEAQLSDRK